MCDIAYVIATSTSRGCMMSWRDTTYVGFHGGDWTPSRRSEVDAVATLTHGRDGLVWDLPSRRAPRGLTGNTLHPAILDQTIFEWFFNTIAPTRHVIGVNTPFGWPMEFRSFLDGGMPSPIPHVDDTSANPVLFRESDRFAEELLGVEPDSMLHHADSVTKMHTVMRILRERVNAHVAFIGRASNGTWYDLDTLIVETDAFCADFSSAFKKTRRELFARINKELVANGKPRLKVPEKVALASALIALGLDQAICDPVENNTLYLVPDGLLPVGDVQPTRRHTYADIFHADNLNADEESEWKKHIDRKRIQYEGFPTYPIDKKKLERWVKKKQKS